MDEAPGGELAISFAASSESESKSIKEELVVVSLRAAGLGAGLVVFCRERKGVARIFRYFDSNLSLHSEVNDQR